MIIKEAVLNKPQSPISIKFTKTEKPFVFLDQDYGRYRCNQIMAQLQKKLKINGSPQNDFFKKYLENCVIAGEEFVDREEFKAVIQKLRNKQ